MLISKTKIRKFIKEASPKITRISPSYYEAIDQRVRNMILGSINQNTSRKTLTQNELTGINGKLREEKSNG